MDARTGDGPRRTTGPGRTRAAAAALLVTAGLVAAALAGCTTDVTGTGRAAEQPASVAPSPPDAPRPLPPSGPGAQVEAIRLASATPLIEDDLPERADGCVPFGPFTDPAELERVAFLPGTVEPALRRSGFVAAWSQCRQGGDGRGTLAITIAVADAAAARSMVTELATTGVDPTGDAVVLPGSGAVGSVVTAGGEETLQAWTSAGRTVGYLFHSAPSGRASTEADRLMVRHRSLLEDFYPTPLDRLAELPPDPAGLRPLTLEPPGTVDPLTGPYGLDSLVRQAIDPVAERAVLVANGFGGAYARNSTDGRTAYSVTTYRFPTSTQTNAVWVEFARLEAAEYGGSRVVARSLPAAPCFAVDAGTDAAPLYFQRCYVGYGRHLARVEVVGAAAADDLTIMDSLLPAQRDLIEAA